MSHDPVSWGEGVTLTQDEGLVIKNYSGFYYVEDKHNNFYECKVRGKVKEKILSGDRVVFTRLETGRGILEKVLPRDNQLYRPRVANVTLVLIVMAFDQPKPDLALLDRLLFLALYNRITPYIILNKCDLPIDKQAQSILDYYPDSFKVIQTSAQQNIGIEILRDAIDHEIAVFAGPSGAGKSSLLKKLTGEVDIPTQAVSQKIGRGKHTTRHVELYPLVGGGWIVDTPGFSVLDMPSLRREDLGHYFPDFLKHNDDCKFVDCLHYREQECGVKTAVETGGILSPRYHNYLAMLEETIEKERCY